MPISDNMPIQPGAASAPKKTLGVQSQNAIASQQTSKVGQPSSFQEILAQQIEAKNVSGQETAVATESQVTSDPSLAMKKAKESYQEMMDIHALLSQAYRELNEM